MKQILFLLLLQSVLGWRTSLFAVQRRSMSNLANQNPPDTLRLSRRTPDTSLDMGLMDSFSNFLNTRDDDFMKLEESVAVYGPGPLLIVYGIPVGIQDEEIQDMISDGAPNASKKNVKVVRLSTENSNILDLSMQNALEGLNQGSIEPSTTDTQTQQALDVPVIFFSGFDDNEMLSVYNILGGEIYEETGGQASAACAKAVPNAMKKPLRQVLDEISGDHQDALSLDYKKEEE